jgi:iron complex transport system substrate-binding protein
MRKIKWFMLVLVMLLAILPAGCGTTGGDNVNNENNVPDNGEVNGLYPMTIVDDNGQSVEITSEPQRIVSLMPSLTETLFALGLGERVVGVTDYCNYPNEVSDIEKIGSLWSINAEVILSLEPDLIFTTEGITQQEVLDVLTANNLTVMVVNPQNLDEIEESFRLIAKVAGVPENGEELASQVRADREAFIAKVTVIPAEERPNVFIMVDDQLYTVGSGVFMDDLITIAGGVNIAADLSSGWFQMSEEQLLELNPDLIISSYITRDEILGKAAWQELNAVKNERIYKVNDDLTSRPGPRIVQGLEELYNVFFVE